jgi:uncharacterized protein
MARAPTALPDIEALRARVDAGGRLAVKVTPGAREESVTLTDDAVLVKVRAPADKGAANEAVAERTLAARAAARRDGAAEDVRGGVGLRRGRALNPEAKAP